MKKLLELKDIKSSFQSKLTVPDNVTENISALHIKISNQGEKVRNLKSSKAAKDAITSEVNILLNLKAEYKALSGEEWKPKATPILDNKEVDALDNKIIAQGDKVRQLKLEKAATNIINSEVQKLLSLKEEYKKVSGTEWKPRETPTSAVQDSQTQKRNSEQLTSVAKPKTESNNSSEEELTARVVEQGDIVRQLKASKASKVIFCNCTSFYKFKN